MKRCLMVTGGVLEREFAEDFLKGRKYDFIIAVDAGAFSCFQLGLHPDLLVGDFDTFGRDRILQYQKEPGCSIDIHQPEKDETDTELAFRDALEAGCGHVDVLGATGGRLDHEISNIHLLVQFRKKGLTASLYDSHNKISVIDSEKEKETVFFRRELYGKYVSFLPLTEEVKGITLTGFKYPLSKKNISILENPSLCISNELTEERAVMSFDQGILICVESRD